MRHAQPFADPGRAGAGCWRALPLSMLVLALVLLLPLAHASPPDPIWISGSYDADDHDDAVLAAASLDGRAMPRAGLTPVWLVVGPAHPAPPLCPGSAVVAELCPSAAGGDVSVSVGRAPPAR